MKRGWGELDEWKDLSAEENFERNIMSNNKNQMGKAFAHSKTSTMMMNSEKDKISVMVTE